MALVAQRIPVQFRSLNSKPDPRYLMVGDLTALRNVVFDEFPRLKKRPGSAPLATAAAGAQIAPYKSQLLVGDGAEAWGLANGKLVDKGALESMAISVRPAARDVYPKQTPDAAVHPAGITVHTFESVEGGTAVARYTVTDSATGQPIVSNVSLGATATRAKPLALGAYVIVVYFDSATSHLRYVALPATSPATPLAAVDLAIDSAASPVFDAAVIGGLQGRLFVAYLTSGGKIAVTFLTSGLIVGSEAQLVTAAATALGIFGDASLNVWLAYSTATTVYAVAYDYALSGQRFAPATVDAAPGTVRNITGIAPAGVATLFYEAGVGNGAAGSLNNLVRTATVSASGAVSGVGVYVRSLGLASKPFFCLGRTHILAAYDSIGASPLQRTYFLLSGPSATVVGKLASRVGGGLTVRSLLPEAVNPSAGIFQTSYLQTDQIGAQAGQIVSQAGAMLGSFDFTQPQASVELSDDLHLTGGVLSMFDGAQVCEHGFHLYPENLQATAGGSGTISGTYQVVAVYEWMDAQGLIHQSSPSPVVTVAASSAAYFDYTVAALRVTAKATRVGVVFYRTIANQTVFYRVTPISAPVLSDPTADTVSAPSHGDATSDASLQGNAQLIFNPLNSSAEVPPLSAPAPRYAWRYRNRIAMIPAEDPFQWLFSKAFVPGTPIEFNDQQLYQAVSQDGGPLTCGIEMDGFNVLFSATRIYQVAGDGPAANGSGFDYGSAPQNVPSDVGCSNPRSLVLTPAGVMFQASGGKGIYLLDRGMNVRYIGAEVEEFNGLAITAARLAPNSRRIMLYTAGGPTLCYDYLVGKWSVWDGVSAADACVFGGLLTRVLASGIVLQETPGAFTENGNPILIGLTTSIVAFAGIAGLQRVYRLSLVGDYRSPHRLSVSIAYDDSPAPSQTATVDAGALLAQPVGGVDVGDVDSPGGGAFPGYEFVVKLAQQKCRSIQVTIQEAQTGNYGEGCSLSALAFTVGVKKGGHPVSAARVLG